MKKRRSNGEGGLSWDKERQKWCGTLRDTSGKPHKFRHTDKVEVINWLNKMRLVYSSLNPLYSYDTTLQDFAFAFIKNKAANPKIAESTVNYYTYLASKLYPLANEVMNKITSEDINAFIAEADLSASNKSKVYKFLKILFGAARKNNLILENPMDIAIAPEYEPEYDEPFTPEEIKLIISKLKNTPKFLRYYALCSLESVIGARIGEILGIERSTLNFEKNYCKIKDAVKADINGRTYVGKTKTKASVRIQYFDAGIGKILQDYLAACNVDSKYLFCTANGTPISVRNMQRAWKMILKHANVRYRSFHYLRHSFITEMFIQGYAAADIAAVVGHSRLETTNKYALRRQDKVLEIAKTAANIYNIA